MLLHFHTGVSVLIDGGIALCHVPTLFVPTELLAICLFAAGTSLTH